MRLIPIALVILFGVSGCQVQLIPTMSSGRYARTSDRVVTYAPPPVYYVDTYEPIVSLADFQTVWLNEQGLSNRDAEALASLGAYGDEGVSLADIQAAWADDPEHEAQAESIFYYLADDGNDDDDDTSDYGPAY